MIEKVIVVMISTAPCILHTSLNIFSTSPLLAGDVSKTASLRVCINASQSDRMTSNKKVEIKTVNITVMYWSMFRGLM